MKNRIYFLDVAQITTIPGLFNAKIFIGQIWFLGVLFFTYIIACLVKRFSGQSLLSISTGATLYRCGKLHLWMLS
jgi:hypothetical protein